MSGSAGKEMAGAGLIFSMLIAGFVALTNGLAIAEFASRVPLIGGDYTYTFLSSGEFIGFTLGWLSLTKEPMGNAISAVAVTYYLYAFLDAMDLIDSDMEDSYWFGKDYNKYLSVQVLSPMLVIASAVFVYCGIKINTRLLTIVAIWNISLLLLFGVSGLFLFDSDVMLHPCSAENIKYGEDCPKDADNSMIPYGVKGVFTASAIAFWSFLGPESIVYIAEECVNPMRDIPRAIYISYALVFFLYTFVITVLAGMVPFQSLNSRAPLAMAFSMHGEKLLMGICSLGALTAITGVFFQSGVGAPRVYLRLSIDGMIPKCCKYIHPKYRTPKYGILYFFTIVLLASAFLGLSLLLELYSSLTLILMALSQCSLLVMRFSPPSLMETNSTSIELVASPMQPVSPAMAAMTRKKRSSYKEVHITRFWTHKKVLFTIYGFFLWTLGLCFVTVHRDYFIENELSVLLIALMIVFIILVLLSGVLIVYMSCEFPWLHWIPEYERNHKIMFMPCGPYLNLIAIGVDCYLLALLVPTVWYEVSAVMLVGVLFYFAYSYRHSYFREEKQTFIVRSQSI